MDEDMKMKKKSSLVENTEMIVKIWEDERNHEKLLERIVEMKKLLSAVVILVALGGGKETFLSAPAEAIEADLFVQPPGSVPVPANADAFGIYTYLNAATTPVALGAAQVVTAGTPVTAIPANIVSNGCYIQNDPAATTNLIVDPVGTANHTTPTSTSSFVPPGVTWRCPGAVRTAVTIDSYDNAHKFYGVRY